MNRLQEAQKELQEKIERVSELGKITEERAWSKEEREEAKNLDVAIDDLKEEITLLEKTQERKKAEAKRALDEQKRTNVNVGVSSESESKSILTLSKRFSAVRAAKILAGMEREDGVEAEMNSEARREAHQGGANFGYKGIAIPGSVLRAEWEAAEKRTDIDQTTSGIQPTVVGRYVEAIRQDAVFSRVIPGSNILTGLTGDYKIPSVGSQALAWATAENSAAADGGANFGKDTLAPVRLTGYADISNRVLLQNGEQAMNAVMADFGRETANKIDAALFSTTDVTNAIPSIAGTTGVLTFTEAAVYAAPSNTANGSIYSDFLEALQELANANAAGGALAFVGHTKLMSDLVKSPQVLGTKAAVDGKMMGAPLMLNLGGVPFYLTTSNTSNAAVSADFIGGNFNFSYIGFFGGLDMSLDPYSVKLNDQVRIVVHRHLDASAIRGAAFVKATSLLA